MKSESAAAGGRDLRVTWRPARMTLRAGARRDATRLAAAVRRDAGRRDVVRRVRTALELRDEMRFGIWHLERITAADRIAVCSLEKRLSRRP